MWGILGVVIFCIVLQLPNDRIESARETVFFWPTMTLIFFSIPYILSSFAYSFVYDMVEPDSHTWVMILINLLIVAWFVFRVTSPFEPDDLPKDGRNKDTTSFIK